MLGLTRIVDAAEAMQTSSRVLTIAVMRERCTRYRHQASTCSCCMEVCPSGALNLSGNHPVLNASICKECGSCASACPTGAIEMKSPADKELSEQITERAAQAGRVTVTCKQAGAAASESVSVACLARLDPSLLLLALARGASQVSLVPGECGKCVMGANLARLQHTVATAESLATAVGAHARISIQACARTSASMPVNTSVGVSRRSFLTMFGKGGVGYTAEAATALIATAPQKTDHGLKRGTLAAHLPEKRRRLVESLRVLATNARSPQRTATVFSAPQIDATRCTGCGMCADICPTGSLAAEQKTPMLRITCDASACVSCKLCVDACYVHAVSLRPRSGNMLSEEHATLLERYENDDLHVSIEDKMSRLLGANLYRT